MDALALAQLEMPRFRPLREAANLRLPSKGALPPLREVTSCFCGLSFWGPRGLPLEVRVWKEIKVADRAEILSILQGAKSEHIEYM